MPGVKGRLRSVIRARPVLLIRFYLDEANDEDLMHNLTIRGKRILPYLLK